MFYPAILRKNECRNRNTVSYTHLQNAGDQLEEVMGKRTRAIERKLRQVEALPAEDSQRMLSLPELTDDEMCIRDRLCTGYSCTRYHDEDAETIFCH